MERIIEIINKTYYRKNNQLKIWGQQHLSGLFIFNIIVAVLLLLHANGYFLPFFAITMNMIIFLAIILAVTLLGARSRVCFILALVFWIFAAFLRIVKVEIWAERTVIYVFEFLVVGVIILILESKKTDKDKLVNNGKNGL